MNIDRKQFLFLTAAICAGCKSLEEGSGGGAAAPVGAAEIHRLGRTGGEGRRASDACQENVSRIHHERHLVGRVAARHGIEERLASTAGRKRLPG